MHMDFHFGVAPFAPISKDFYRTLCPLRRFYKLCDSDPFRKRLHIEVAFLFLWFLGSEGFFGLRCSAVLSSDYFTAKVGI